MSKIGVKQWLPSCILSAAVAWYASAVGPGVVAAEKADRTSTPDPGTALVRTLQADGPHPSLGDHAKVLGRLIGTWDVQYMDISKDGKANHRSGQLIVAWVLDGRAVQDVWIVDPSGTRKEREVYTDVRYFDPKSTTWPAIFVDPESASVARFVGGAVGDDRIDLHSQDLGAGDTRWSFYDIHPDSLAFRDEISSDGGQTWKLRSEYHMQRHGTVAAAQ